jgi:hypothetical protein
MNAENVNDSKGIERAQSENPVPTFSWRDLEIILHSVPAAKLPPRLWARVTPLLFLRLGRPGLGGGPPLDGLGVAKVASGRGPLA